MKNEQNQEFRSSGALLIVALVTLSFVIVITPWNRHLQDSRVEVALQKAEIVGYQVVQIYREASSASVQEKSDLRGPASTSQGENSAVSNGFLENLRSTGTMGADPWGMPYRYRIIAADTLGNVKILVWSSGPNRKVETAQLDDESTAVVGQPSYAGDDIGVLLSMTRRQ